MAKAKKSKLESFYGLVEDIETAMFTTRRKDGLLVSRPMATQVRAAGADLWFATDKRSEKIDEVRNDANVNLSYYNNRTREWISVAGRARVVTDRKKIQELWRPDWRAWFGDEGGANDGTANDPRIVLLGVDIRLAIYLEVNKPQPVVLFEVLKGMITGKRPDFPEPKSITGKSRSRKATGSTKAKASSRKTTSSRKK